MERVIADGTHIVEADNLHDVDYGLMGAVINWVRESEMWTHKWAFGMENITSYAEWLPVHVKMEQCEVDS